MLATALILATTMAAAIAAADDTPRASVSWSTAITDTGSREGFNQASVNVRDHVGPIGRLRIETGGMGHSHGSPVTLSVRLLPSQTVVWSATSAAVNDWVSMAIDVSFAPVSDVTDVQITSDPFQHDSYHSWSDHDVIYLDVFYPYGTVKGPIACFPYNNGALTNACIGAGEKDVSRPDANPTITPPDPRVYPGASTCLIGNVCGPALDPGNPGADPGTGTTSERVPWAVGYLEATYACSWVAPQEPCGVTLPG